MMFQRTLALCVTAVMLMIAPRGVSAAPGDQHKNHPGYTGESMPSMAVATRALPADQAAKLAQRVSALLGSKRSVKLAPGLVASREKQGVYFITGKGVDREVIVVTSKQSPGVTDRLTILPGNRTVELTRTATVWDLREHGQLFNDQVLGRAFDNLLRQIQALTSK